MKDFRDKIKNVIRDMVFGIEDALVSTTGVLVGIAGAQTDSKVIILSGFVVIVVEAISMGAGSYLSEKKEKELYQSLIEKEKKEIKNHPKAERKELVAMFKERGFTDKEIEILVSRIMKNDKLILENMVHKELNLPFPLKTNSKIGGLVMFVSYFLSGLIPLSPYFFLNGSMAIMTSLIFSAIGLFILGVLIARLSNEKKLRSGVEMVVIAGVAALFGYIIGQIVEMFL